MIIILFSFIHLKGIEHCYIFKGILIQQTKNVQTARQSLFTSLKEISQLKKIWKPIFQAIELEKSDSKFELKKVSEFDMAKELKIKLDESIT
jgi:uncharacterized protein YdeI (YjbR/CyaY-like superfamily)